MVASVNQPGVGTLVAQDGPGGLTCWRLEQEVPVNVMLEAGERLDDIDMALLAEVAADLPGYVQRAYEFVLRQLLSDPVVLGLTLNDVDINMSADDVPLESPQLNFYVGRDWVVHFQLGSYPICEPIGLGVAFNRYEPVGIEDLSDSAPIE